MLDVRLAAIMQQLGGIGRPDLGSRPLASSVGVLHCFDDPGFDLLQIVGIDATVERVRSPQSQRIRPFVVVCARHQDIVEFGELLADRLRDIVKQADNIDRDKSELLFPVSQNNGSSHDWVMHAPSLAVLTEAGEIDRFLADRRGHIGLSEADLEGRVSPQRRPSGSNGDEPTDNGAEDHGEKSWVRGSGCASGYPARSATASMQSDFPTR
jgi:hypothetical protein